MTNPLDYLPDVTIISSGVNDGGNVTAKEMRDAFDALRKAGTIVPSCRVYWGSHGCHLPRGHPGSPVRGGDHVCCCDCENHPDFDPEVPDQPEGTCVGAFPYYGATTTFYGEDAPVTNRVQMADLDQELGICFEHHAGGVRYLHREGEGCVGFRTADFQEIFDD